MAKFKPFATITVASWGNGRTRDTKTFTYNSYRELKRDMKNLVNKSEDGEVRVTRSRLGQWGEWFEIWRGGKISAQTWM